MEPKFEPREASIDIDHESQLGDTQIHIRFDDRLGFEVIEYKKARLTIRDYYGYSLLELTVVEKDGKLGVYVALMRSKYGTLPVGGSEARVGPRVKIVRGIKLEGPGGGITYETRST